MRIYINDLKITAIAELESNEPLVEMNGNKIYQLNDLKYPLSTVTFSTTPFIRKSVKEKINNALKFLPSQYGFLIVEGYRSYSYQKLLFAQQVKKLSEELPKLEHNKILELSARYVSNPDVFSPHVTGGA